MSPHTDPPDSQPSGPRICDYEGSSYRTDFWESPNRSFEDAVDRAMLADLLPAQPGRLIEIGAGYGRLVDAYSAADEVFLLDFAPSMLKDAVGRVPSGTRLVCADLYRLPFSTAAIDTAVQVRVLHHVEDVPDALVEVARILRPGGSYVLEYANKRHAKSIGRWLTGQQAHDPFDPRPHEFVELNWNFHPQYIEAALQGAGLKLRERRSASHFRSATLKTLPATLLAKIDHLVGRATPGLALGPSQYLRATCLSGIAATGLWRCPVCGHEPLEETGAGVPCPACRRLWPRENDILLMRRPFDRPQ